jgi:hypothetical protein
MLKEILRRLKDGKQISRDIEDIDDGIQDIYTASKKIARTLLEIGVAISGVVFLAYKTIIPVAKEKVEKFNTDRDSGIVKVGETPNLKIFKIRGR